MKTEDQKIEDLRNAGIGIRLVPMAIMPYFIYGVESERNELVGEGLMNIDEAHRKVCGSKISYDPFTDEYIKIR